MLSPLLLVLCLLVVSCHFSLGYSEFPRSETENGPVIGVYETSYSGSRYLAFKGIPYAKPPVNDNRFKEPQRLEEKWIGEWNAKQFGSPCLQVDHFTRSKLENGSLEFHTLGDEDCLYLNVFTQDGGHSGKNVIFFIHAGAFMWGTGNYYGPEFVMDRPDIVYVTFNYRLGPLGFLTTGDGTVPGNNGLKDQIAALEWVHRNIHNFGGDASKITIAGLSAGGASVDYMYLTPLSKGLFQRGYSFSGSSLCSWAFVADGAEKSRQLAKQLGCPVGSSESMVQCLRQRPAKLIIEQVRTFQPWLYNPYTVFGPVIEVNSSRPFIDQHPRSILQKGLSHDLPWVAGVTSEDGLYPAADYVASESLMRMLQNEWQRIGPTLLFPHPSISKSKQSQIAVAAKNHYLGTADITFENREGLVKLMTDRLFIGGVAEAAALRFKTNTAPVYLYLYGLQGATSVSNLMSGSSIQLGCCHGDDLIQVVNLGPVPSHTTNQDRNMAVIIKDILFSYVANGVIPDYLNWKPVASSDLSNLNYLSIKSPTDIKMSTEPLGELEYLAKLFGESLTHDEL